MKLNFKENIDPDIHSLHSMLSATPVDQYGGQHGKAGAELFAETGSNLIYNLQECSDFTSKHC